VALYVAMRKVAEDERTARYAFGLEERFDRTLLFDKESRAVQSEDGEEDPIFRAAAAKVARTWRDRRQLPDTLVHAS
jgi:hypothetical protein